MEAVFHGLQGIFEILFMIGIGFVLSKKGWFGPDTSAILTRLIMKVALPLFMICQLERDFTHDSLLRIAPDLALPFLSILLAYVVGRAAAAALLFCSWTMLPLLNLMTIHSFTVHALLFMYPVMLLAGGFRPDVKKLVRIIPFLAIVLIVIQIINVSLGTSFFFINGAGEGNPLSLLEDTFGRPWYLIPAFFLVVLLWCVMYSVSAFAFRRKGKKG